MAITANIALTYRTAPASHAPLHVYCDGTGTTSDVATTALQVWQDIRYIWTVIPPSGVVEEYWTAGPMPSSKFEGFGPVEGFLLKEPGTYTIRLSVWDGVSYDEAETTVTVSSQDDAYPTTSTICFSNDTDFTGAPAGSTRVTTSSWSEILTYITADNLRILLKRGHSFAMDAPVVGNGYNLIGNYSGITVDGFGTAASKFKLTAAADVTGAFFNSNYKSLHDNTVSGIEFEGAAGCLAYCFDSYTGTRGTFHDFKLSGRIHNFLTNDTTQLATVASEVYKHLGFYEVDTSGCIISGLCMFFGYENYIVRGCTLDDSANGTTAYSSSQAQLMRPAYSYKSAIHNMTLKYPGRPDNDRQCIKAHGITYIHFTADTTSGSAVLTNVTGVPIWDDLFTSHLISGTGIAADSWILSHDQGAATITMAVNATATASAVALVAKAKPTIYADNGDTKYFHACDISIDPGYYGGAAGMIYYSPSSSVAVDATHYLHENVSAGLIERVFVKESTGQTQNDVAVWVAASNTKARNIVIELDSSLSHIHEPITVKQDAASVAGQGYAWAVIDAVEIDNVTVYYKGTDTGFVGARVGPDATNTVIKNYLIYAPTASSPAIIADAGTGTVTSNNTTDVTTDPLFNVSVPVDIKGYALQSGSPYNGAGAAVPNFTDAIGNSRKVHSAALDTGAMCSTDKQHRFKLIG